MKHLVGVLEGTTIRTTDELEFIMNTVAESEQFTVVARAFHQFQPMGATGVLVLAESHFSAHTYPEHQRVYVDVFCCNPQFNARRCSATLQAAFGATSFQWSCIDRNPDVAQLQITQITTHI
jgi:S-adenosylmethionine decarboxylase proenzyme